MPSLLAGLPDGRARGLPKRALPYGTVDIRGQAVNTTNSNANLTLPVVPTSRDIILCASGVNADAAFLLPTVTGFMFFGLREARDSVGVTRMALSIGFPLPGYTGAFGSSLSQGWSSTSNRAHWAAVLTPRDGFVGIMDRVGANESGGNLGTFTVQRPAMPVVDRPGGLWVAATYIDGGNGIHFGAIAASQALGWRCAPGQASGCAGALWLPPTGSIALAPPVSFQTGGNDSWVGIMAHFR